MAFRVQVDGLREFQRDLRAAKAKMPAQMRQASMAVARLMADAAKAKGQSLGGVHAKAAPSVRPSAGATFASLRAGGPAHPYFWGSEFGSVNYKQFPSYRKSGYYVYPTLKERGVEAGAVYAAALDRTLGGVF